MRSIILEVWIADFGRSLIACRLWLAYNSRWKCLFWSNKIVLGMLESVTIVFCLRVAGYLARGLVKQTMVDYGPYVPSFTCRPKVLIGVLVKWNVNSENLGNLINHQTMYWGQFLDMYWTCDRFLIVNYFPNIMIKNKNWIVKSSRHWFLFKDDIVDIGRHYHYFE